MSEYSELHAIIERDNTKGLAAPYERLAAAAPNTDDKSLLKDETFRKYQVNIVLLQPSCAAYSPLGRRPSNHCHQCHVVLDALVRLLVTVLPSKIIVENNVGQ